MTGFRKSRGKFGVAILGAAQLALVSWIAGASHVFEYGNEESSRPILGVVAILSVMFALSMASLFLALRLPDTRRLTWLILGFAIAMRSVLLWSEPIQEVDIYRYVWDGAVTSQGISPYRFSPQSITDSEQRNVEIDSLVDLLASAPGLAEVHRRVHYPQFTTVYPPISQLVFSVAYAATPSSASLQTYVRTMKLMVVGFDIGVLLLLISVLKSTGKHSGWAIVYGWSPLVLKEFANSGHLDSIAVFLMLASACCLVGMKSGATSDSIRLLSHRFWCAIFLGLGVGAKLFPIVLAPFFAVYVLKKSGFRSASIWLGLFVTTTATALAPMMLADRDRANEPSGLAAFLQYWEINDLLFMVIEENLRPDNRVAEQPVLWFVVVPNSARVAVTDWSTNLTSVEAERIPFIVTRALTTMVLGLLALTLLRHVAVAPERILEFAFLMLAWFWFLSPTQNPWYWTWAMPLLPFARSRVWLLVAGFSILYYVRFWTEYHSPTVSLLGQTYVGTAVFDFLIVWLEFLPVFVLLIISVLLRSASGTGITSLTGDDRRFEPAIVPAEH